MWINQKLVALCCDYFRPERENNFVKIVDNTKFIYTNL